MQNFTSNNIVFLTFLFIGLSGPNKKGLIVKKIVFSAFIAAASMMATPAFAEVESGARIEAFAGLSELSIDMTDFKLGKKSDSSFVEGIGLGYDFAVSSKTAIGVDLEYLDPNEKINYNATNESLKAVSGDDLYVGARATFAVSKSLSLYTKAGYARGKVNASYISGTKTEKIGGVIDGIRAGVGAQLSFGKLYGFAEYRYTDYKGLFSRSQAMVGLGARF
jgi:outer membrane immunogenic protein